MDDSRKECIDDAVNKNKVSINAIDNAFYRDMTGVAQAIGQLKAALDKVDTCLNQREFEQASNLGYSDVSSEFIFLQRCLGSLNDTVMQKEKVIQDICSELTNQLDNINNEEVTASVENELESIKPITKPAKVEISLGQQTIEKLHSIQNIRHTPIEHLVELIIASAMKNDEKHWQELEKGKMLITNIKTENKEYYTADEVTRHINALSEQEEERLNNLY